MRLIIAGTGPGEGRLLTLSAFQRAKEADIILVPRAHGDLPGQAEKVITKFFPEQKIVHMTFPMTSSAGKRDRAILSQLEALRETLCSTRRATTCLKRGGNLSLT